MTRLLYVGDYICPTGFGTVSRNIVQSLYQTGEYEVDVLGINYNGDPYDHEMWPGNVYPAMPGGMVQPPYNDVYGRQRMLDLLGLNQYDAVMILQDSFVIKEVAEVLKNATKDTATASIYYYPIDSTVDEGWIKGVVDTFDFPVAYTDYGKGQTLKVVPELESKLQVIYHGTNLTDFYPVSDKEKKDFRTKYFEGVADGRFLITNVSRNQIRKDVLHSLMAIKQLRQTHPEALLYMHMAETDQGGSINAYAQQLGLKPGEDYLVPLAFNKGLGVDQLNMLYNISDCLLLSTHGEGWGLPVTEAYATKTPVVIPANTALLEIGADNRALLVACNDYHTYGHADNCRLRPVVDYSELSDTLSDLIEGKQKPDVEAAYEWAKGYSWENVCRDWHEIIQRAAGLTKRRREAQAQQQFINPNRQQRRSLERQK